MVPFVHFQPRKQEGVVAVAPCDGFGPGTVFALGPACALGIVDRPINLQGLACIGILRFIGHDVGRNGHKAAILVLDDQPGQAEAVRFCAPVVALGSADGPTCQVVPFVHFQSRDLEGVVPVAPCDGFGPGAVFALGPACTLGIVDGPVDAQGLSCGILLPNGVQVDALAGLSQVNHLLAALVDGRSVRARSPALEHVTLTGEGIRILQRDVLAHVGGRGGLILLRISGDITAVAVVHNGVLVRGSLFRFALDT